MKRFDYDNSGRGEEKAPRTIRCAIYTRKSTEEGLDQEFNSLDAQREAAESFIASQRLEGWVALPERYDDGGFTGGNMERPALKRLMAEAEAGQIDCIVVYKVDRLSRSLMDFARIMEVLDRRNVSFVSVTQQFNTTNSMGRLTLNILLSFAQFEREIIAERTRDKMSAARRKGKWVGGMPVLGYDVDPRGSRLLVNEEEAVRVREIFEIYLQEQGLIPSVQEVTRRGLTTKRWITKKGVERGGGGFNKNSLFGLLTNIIYIGKVDYKGEIFEGEHPAIVDETIWRRVQERLRQNGRSGGVDVRNKYGGLLKGLLYCEACHAAMIHTWTISDRGKRRYRYYVCSHAQKHGWDTCPTKSLPAHDIEKFVVERIRAIGQDDALLQETLRAARIENEDRLLHLQDEERSLLKDLRDLSTEERTVAKEVGKIGMGSVTASDMLSRLQIRMREANQRATEVRTEIIAISSQLVSEREMRLALSLFDPVWESLTPREQTRAMRFIVERVGYNPAEGCVSIQFQPTGIRALAEQVAQAETPSENLRKEA
ncbi:MAG TPA: recombinase family protein [Candidatus Sumerlaeota bacterium]|nr:recombinase family protein [Candidatus Sumerlaeota bacterium]